MKDQLFRLICRLFGKGYLDYASKHEIQVRVVADNKSLRDVLKDTEQVLSEFTHKLETRYGGKYLEILELIVKLNKNEGDKI
jgi:hypothetical protein